MFHLLFLMLVLNTFYAFDFPANQQRHVRFGQFADALREVIQHSTHQRRGPIESYAFGAVDMDQQSHGHPDARGRFGDTLQCLNVAWN